MTIPAPRWRRLFATKVSPSTPVARSRTPVPMERIRSSSTSRRKTCGAGELFSTGWAARRTPSLALGNAGVETERGRIISNAQMQTSASHIFAKGDCTEPREMVHGVQQGRSPGTTCCADSPQSMDYRLLTSVVFTDPQAAVVGLTEKAAKEQGISYLTANYPFNDRGKSIIMEAMHGFVKLLCDPKSGEILEGACVGPMGGELIHEIVAAMAVA